MEQALVLVTHAPIVLYSSRLAPRNNAIAQYGAVKWPVPPEHTPGSPRAARLTVRWALLAPGEQRMRQRGLHYLFVFRKLSLFSLIIFWRGTFALIFLQFFSKASPRMTFSFIFLEFIYDLSLIFLRKGT